MFSCLKSSTVNAPVQYLDTFELARLGLKVKGQTPLSHFSRLLADLPAQADSVVTWSVVGEHSASGQFFLRVRTKGAVTLECQRCLAPLEWQVDTLSRLLVVSTEADLGDGGHEDAEAAQDSIERIVGSHRFDILTLIEDEIILVLPYVPKHDVCPAALNRLVPSEDSQADEAAPSPFAVLGRLKKN